MESNYLIDNFDMKFNKQEFSYVNDDIINDDDLIMNSNFDDDDDNNNDDINFLNFDLNEELKNLMINNETTSNKTDNHHQEEEEIQPPITAEIELKTNNDSNKQQSDNIEGEDDHLPRVQVELDKLNYANESINNLELELEVY